MQTEMRTSMQREAVAHFQADKRNFEKDFWTLGLQAGGERKYSLSMPEVPE